MASTFNPYVGAVNLIPATGEFTYDTEIYEGQYPGGAMTPVNAWRAPGAGRADLLFALDDLQVSLPNCRFVAIVVQWLGSSLDASQCKVYPSSTYIGGGFQPAAGGSDSWRVSDVTLATPGLIPISRPDGVHSAYGGTPSDQSIIRCIQEIRRRGLKVALYLQMNMDAPGQPWRGLCGFSPDVTAQAASVAANFLGAAATSDFTADPVALTVHYSGPVLDFTYRRFVLHYAWLCTLAGGVDLFTMGSELRGLEAIRGPNWTPAGSLDASGAAVWDYPFVAGLQALARDVRAVFDGAGLGKNLSARANLVAYSADWSQWTGVQHPGVAGIFPHLDPLFAMPEIDVVSFDNYLPLSDWTTGDGGLDFQNWRASAPQSWPPVDPNAIGFGLSTPPQLHDLSYLKANIEGGEKFHYYYADYGSALGADPSGAGAQITRPQGDRLVQARQPFFSGQELFAFKNLRWWWSNPHRAVYDCGDGQGVAPHGAATAWSPQSKSIAFMEYGFPSIDRATNEQNLFFDPASSAGGAPFWCVWDGVEGQGPRPAADADLQLMGHQAFWEYWTSDGKNEVSAAGPPMVATDLMFAWTWDARPFPTFPLRSDIWSDGSNWRVGHWLAGKGPALPPSAADPAPPAPALTDFPSLAGLGWSVRCAPVFASGAAVHVSGRETRAARRSRALWRIELTYDLLTREIRDDVDALVGFFESLRGRAQLFAFSPPQELGLAPLACRFAEDFIDVEEFMSKLYATRRLGLMSAPQ